MDSLSLLNRGKLMWTLRYFTINCVRVWRYYWNAGPAEVVKSSAIACVRGAAIGLPLLLPGAALVSTPSDTGLVSVPPMSGPPLFGPAYSLGPGVGLGGFEQFLVSPLTPPNAPFSSTLSLTPELSTPTGPTLTPSVAVPEPASLALLVPLLILLLALRR